MNAQLRNWTASILGWTITITGCAPSESDDGAGLDAQLRAASAMEVSDVGDAGSMTAASLYPRVVEIIERSCSYERCHAGPLVGAGLSFEPGADHYRALVGVRACEYDLMARVEPGDPDRSWLMVKLTAAFRPLSDNYAHAIYFTPPADWNPGRRGCRDQTRDGVPLFGQRMPATSPNTLPKDELDVLRRWIAEGAPR